MSGLSDAIAIAIAIATGKHTVALKGDGTAWAWGLNGCGQLGDGTTISRTTPVQVSGLSGVVALAVGDGYTVALKSDGRVWAWGCNYYGQLGNGTATNRTTPVQVSGLSGVVALAAGGVDGGLHTVALRNDGTVWAWGRNNVGQLGDGTTNQRYSPIQVLSAGGVGFLNLHRVTLTASKTGTGSGTVTSSPAGIDCSSACQGNRAIWGG